MITPVVDSEFQSGVRTPLLPCLETARRFGGGLYGQTCGGSPTALLGVCGSTAYCHAESGAYWDELARFCSFRHLERLLADVAFPGSRPLALLTLTESRQPTREATFLQPASAYGDYLFAAELLFEDPQARADFYVSLAPRVLTGHAECACLFREGTCVAAAVAPYVTDNAACVSGVAVAEAERRKGYGSAVVTALTRRLADRGISEITLWCEESLVPFYRRTGFSRRGDLFEVDHYEVF